MVVALAAAVAAAFAILIASFALLQPQQPGAESEGMATEAQAGGEGGGSGSITIIAMSGGGSLLGGGTYRITPGTPITTIAGADGAGAFTVQDDGKSDGNSTPGIVRVAGLRDGNYTVTQAEVPAGHARDRLSKIVEVRGEGNEGEATATFSSQPQSGAAASSSSGSGSAARSVMYTAKFECGTISGSEGPLRPGHYDTDIGILNKQDYAVRMTWNAVVNDGRSTNAILKTLEPQTSAGIVCKDLRQLIGDAKFAEGFVIITVPLGSGPQSAGSSAVVGSQGSQSTLDILDVQVFYTANALDQLPHEVLVDKIVFTITEDPSGKLPPGIIGRTLDVTVRSGLGEVADPEEKARAAVAEQYGMSEQEAAGLAIRVEMVSVGAGTMIDDHALSLSRLPPQAGG